MDFFLCVTCFKNIIIQKGINILEIVFVKVWRNSMRKVFRARNRQISTKKINHVVDTKERRLNALLRSTKSRRCVTKMICNNYNWVRIPTDNYIRFIPRLFKYLYLSSVVDTVTCKTILVYVWIIMKRFC